MKAWHEKSPVKHEHHQCQLCEEYCKNSLRKRAKVLLIARRSNQSILKEINPEYSLEGFDVEAEAPILWPPDAKKKKKTDSLEKTLMLGKIEGGGEGDDRE